MRVLLRLAVAGALAMAFSACEREPKVAAARVTAPQIAPLPLEMRVEQRTTTAVPGTDGHLRLTVDDITRGQVMVSLATDAGETVLATGSLKPSASAQFRYGDTPYELKLSKLENALAGKDYGTFVIGAGAPASLSEEAKIERLIQAIAALQGATFVRNGADHTAQEAADHLRLKLRAKAAEITTAEMFIDLLASKSSMSGDAYLIRMADGSVVPCGEFLRARLVDMKGGERAVGPGASEGPEASHAH